MKKASAAAALAIVGVGAMVGCGSDTHSSTTSSATPKITAVTPSPTGTSSVTVTSLPLTPEAKDADPAAFAVADAPGSFRWTYAHDPLRECSLTPAQNDSAPRITCSAPFPADAPDISVGSFTGRPNAIALTTEGTEPTIVEGGPDAAADLPVGNRLTFGDLSCTALADDSISCTSPDAWFTVRHGTLSSS